MSAALGLIGHSHHNDFPELSNGRGLVDGLLDTIDIFLKGDAPGLHAAIASVLVRVLETRILTDPDIVALSSVTKSPHSLALQIALRVKALTSFDLPTASAGYLAERLEALSPNHVRSDHTRHFNAIAQRDLADRGCTQFRCHTCGYWFRRADLRKNSNEADVEKRQADLFDMGLTLAPAIHADRETDPFKPIKAGKSFITFAAVDHVVPVTGAGTDELENLRIVCDHCNYGKMIYRMPLEPISTTVAASLNVLNHTVPRQIAVVAALLSAGGKCTAQQCNSTVDDSELTVVLDPFEGPKWGAPWNLRVRCYDCAQQSLRAMRTFMAEAL